MSRRVVQRQRVPGLCQLRQVQVVGAAAEETLLDRKKTRVARSAGNVRHVRRRLVERHVVVGVVVTRSQHAVRCLAGRVIRLGDQLQELPMM